MRFVLLSDTHNCHSQVVVPDGDVVIHAGDFCVTGNRTEWKKHGFTEWFASLPHKHKILVPGNHDRFLDPWCEFGKQAVASLDVFMAHGIEVLTGHGRGIRIGGLTIWGCPITPEFCGWSFMLPRQSRNLKAVWDLIPPGLDFLVTHGPPFGILDRNPQGVSCGCELLLEIVKQARPRFHVFGHIHTQKGRVDIDGTSFLNVSICDDRNVPVALPMVIDL